MEPIFAVSSLARKRCSTISTAGKDHSGTSIGRPFSSSSGCFVKYSRTAVTNSWKGIGFEAPETTW